MSKTITDRVVLSDGETLVTWSRGDHVSVQRAMSWEEIREMYRTTTTTLGWSPCPELQATIGDPSCPTTKK